MLTDKTLWVWADSIALRESGQRPGGPWTKSESQGENKKQNKAKKINSFLN